MKGSDERTNVSPHPKIYLISSVDDDFFSEVPGGYRHILNGTAIDTIYSTRVT